MMRARHRRPETTVRAALGTSHLAARRDSVERLVDCEYNGRFDRLKIELSCGWSLFVRSYLQHMYT